MMAGVPTEEALASASIDHSGRRGRRPGGQSRRRRLMGPEPRRLGIAIPWSDVLITIASIVLALHASARC